MDAGLLSPRRRYFLSPQVQSGLHLLSAVHAQLGPQVHPALQEQRSATVIPPQPATFWRPQLDWALHLEYTP